MQVVINGIENKLNLRMVRKLMSKNTLPFFQNQKQRSLGG